MPTTEIHSTIALKQPSGLNEIWEFFDYII